MLVSSLFIQSHSSQFFDFASDAGDPKIIDFFYDYLGRMTAVEELGDTLASYDYDGFSRRTRSVLYDLDGNANTADDQLGTSYAYANDNALTRLDHNFIEPQDIVTDARYVFTYNAVNQITERSISNSSYVFANLTDEDKLYTSNGLNQYTSICTNAGEGVCETGTAQAISCVVQTNKCAF